MEEKGGNKTFLRIQEGVPQPPNVNPYVLSPVSKKRKRNYTVNEFVSGILEGNRTILARL
jgi:hypothetical protein